jgi:site-specific DNA recombinase
MRAYDKLGVPTIHARLCADPGAYPPADPETGWTTGGIYSILANPKYTGHQVFGRVRKGKRVTADKWYWSGEPTHPAIVDRDTWEAAQRVGAEHRSSRDGAIYNPANWRTYPFRSRIRCKICKRRMCGLPKRHPDRKTPTEYFFYACPYNPKTPSHVAAAPDHPRTVQVREDLLQAETLRGLAAYALAPGREQRLAQLIPSTAIAKKEQHDRQTAALERRLKRLITTQNNLMRELRGSFDMPDHAGEEYRRRIRADYATLHTEHETVKAQFTELAADPAPGNDLDLVTLLPEVATDLDELPADLQAELLDVFGIQIVWNAPTRQATFHATITDTTPGIVKALLARATDTHAPATSTAHNWQSPGSVETSS